MAIQPLRVIERIYNPRVRDEEERQRWPVGPWNDEPDLMEWRDEATGYPCLIVRGPMGALCGYVGVPEGHPAHGKHYDAVEAHAHGGLTFSDTCGGNICHVPLPGEPDNVWWLGFDCAHSGDVAPGMLNHYAAAKERLGVALAGIEDYQRNDEYRDVAYVQNECTRLAAELKGLV